jgi:exopolyphosphatase / guanosine-5'-triphosphate,3'-diphosphate pyrophosphatase
MLDEIEVNDTECALKKVSTQILPGRFNDLFEKLICSTHAQRIAMKGLEPMRVEMIVLATLFVKFILENHTFEQLIQSNFALKEGAMFELIKQNN